MKVTQSEHHRFFFYIKPLLLAGIAYRGRLLIEVNTKILNNTDIMDETTENGEINRIPQLASVSFVLLNLWVSI